MNKTLVLTLILLLAACGGSGGSDDTDNADNTDDTSGGGDGGDGGGEEPTGGTPPESLTDSLERLGVTIEPSPRLSNDNVPLPENYAPFGQRIKLSFSEDGDMHIGAPLELLIGGIRLEGSESRYAVIDNLSLTECPISDPFCFRPIEGPDVLQSKSPSEAPWADSPPHTDEHEPPQRLRDAAGGDVDGDGQDDLVTVYVDGGQLALSVQNLQDATVPERLATLVPPSNIAAVADIQVATGDVDGDMRAEMVISITDTPTEGVATNTVVLVLKDSDGEFVELERFEFTTSVNNVRQYSVLAVDNVDYDTPAEIVIILNESDVDAIGRMQHAATRFEIFDDQAGAFSPLLSGVPEVETASETYVPQVADVAIGDIDADTINELVFGGVTQLDEDTSCGVDGNGEDVGINYTLAIYEFDGLGFSKTRAGHSLDDEHLYPSGCAESGAGDNYIRFLDVNLLDIEGDGPIEIQANDLVFDTIPALGARWWPSAAYELNELILFGPSFSDAAFHPGTADIDVHDVNGDGADEVLSYTTGSDGIRIHSWKPVDPETTINPIYTLSEIPIDATAPYDDLNPILVLFDADRLNEGDVQTLQFVEWEFTFTEPLILAAMAAPPCRQDIDQNTDACVSRWGQSQFIGVEGEHEVSYSAGVSTGFSVEFDAGAGFVVDADTRVFGFEAKLLLSGELSQVRVESYEVTKTVSFETGPNEDSVVFSAIPYDVYVYEVIAETIVELDDLEATEQIQRLPLPREPVIRLAERAFYNQNTTDTAVKIDEDVFTHVVGDLASYPNVTEREEILRARQTQLQEERQHCPGCWKLDPDAPVASVPVEENPFRQFDPLDALPGLVSDTVGVGQGGGQTEVAIDFSSSDTQSTALELSAEVEIELIVGPVLAGVSFGRATSWSHTKTTGQETTYSGIVGSIGADDFIESRYRYGMFTYLQNDPDGSGQEFEVINYWVEGIVTD